MKGLVCVNAQNLKHKKFNPGIYNHEKEIGTLVFMGCCTDGDSVMADLLSGVDYSE